MAAALSANDLSPGACQGGAVVVVGAGLAGLFTALKLAPTPVVLISPHPLGEGCSSAWAQGGIAAAISPGDTAQAHAADTIKAGAGLVDEAMAHLLAEEAADRIEDLLRFGVPFDTDIEGKLALSREAAHSARRIARVKGDVAGKAIMQAVTRAVQSAPHIQILEGMSVHALAMKRDGVAGVHLWPTGSLGNATPQTLPAKAVVLATGGIGQLFQVTTNPSGAYGEGIAIAARAGAIIADPEFVQFHPTGLDIGRDPSPLASEAVRGEGASLINNKGERYMLGVHADAELAPRDVVARATFREINAGRGAFLDCREAIGMRLPEAFPTLYGFCEEAGIDPFNDPIPVAPTAHYHMGGVLTDANGRTTIDGLWACGEVAGNGIHGANRLASNSLLETVVFGARAASDIKTLLPARLAANPGSIEPIEVSSKADSEIDSVVSSLRKTMTENAGVVRNENDMRDALLELNEAAQTALPIAIENRVTTARFVLAAALQRKESRGGHFRSDYPEPKDLWARHSYLDLTSLRQITQAARDSADEGSNVIHATFGQ